MELQPPKVRREVSQPLGLGGQSRGAPGLTTVQNDPLFDSSVLIHH